MNRKMQEAFRKEFYNLNEALKKAYQERTLKKARQHSDKLAKSEKYLLTEACLMAKIISAISLTPTCLEIEISKEDGLITKILVHSIERN